MKLKDYYLDLFLSDAEDLYEYLKEPLMHCFVSMKVNSIGETISNIEGLFKEFVTFVNDENGNPIYENTYQYAILRKEWNKK